MTISDALEQAAERLRDSGVSESRREAASLLAFVLQKDAAFLIAHPEYDLSADEINTFEQYLNRRANHEPFQYIVGRQEFYHLDFEVSPDVLIPRPETEILVECAINILSGLENPRLCEIGVGSGCISVSILNAVGSASAVGVDISQGALAVARRNSERHKVDRRLELIKGDVFDGINARTFDLIVSNPPYIPRDHLDSLQAEVRDFEPRVALDGGANGLSIIERIIQNSQGFLKDQGILLLEIGYDQAKTVTGLFDNRAWKEPELIPDLQGIPRIVKIEKN